MKTRRRPLEPGALELLEEAVHLLRRVPTTTLVLYYGASVPFTLALLFFWAHTTWFRPRGDIVAWGALGLAAAFAMMKAAHAEFCARLMATRLGAETPRWSWPRFGRLIVAQMRLQPWALVGSLVAANLVIPFGWTYAYGQSLSVIGDDERLHEVAAAQTKLWPRQNHHALLVLGLVALCAWGNLAATFVGLPMLANRLLGVENIFGFTGTWFLNSTFLASVTALTWLALDPLVKAFYTLRVFHGRARRTGDDVRVELQLARRVLPARVGLAALAILLASPGLPLGAAEAPRPPPATAVAPPALDHAIDEVLTRSDFQWRLPPTAPATKEPDGAIKRFVRGAMDWVRDLFRTAQRWWRAIGDWWDRHFSRPDRDEPAAARTGAASAVTLVRALLYVFIGLAVVLILWVIWLVVKQARRVAPAVVAAQAVATATPDLRDENIQAAQLPADGWLALARQQAALGEWRLALRALYLATLARLATDGLISLAKFKTNLDYERELRRRALSRTEVVNGFSIRRRQFENVWYGHGAAGEAEVQEWMTELMR